MTDLTIHLISSEVCHEEGMGFYRNLCVSDIPETGTVLSREFSEEELKELRKLNKKGTDWDNRVFEYFRDYESWPENKGLKFKYFFRASLRESILELLN